MTMRFFEEPKTIGDGPNGMKVRAFDDADHRFSELIKIAVKKKWNEITGTWPLPSKTNELQVSANNAIPQTDQVALLCFKAGIAFPTEWQTYCKDLLAIANGTDTKSKSLPKIPAMPKGI